jgi:hypothetical protein
VTVNELSKTGLTLISVLALVALVLPADVFSQSCALCYTQAASAGTRMIEALRSGILILIVPPVIMSVCMIFVVYNKRNKVRRDASVPDPDRSW